MADEKTENLLKQWEIPELIERFKGNNKNRTIGNIIMHFLLPRIKEKNYLLIHLDQGINDKALNCIDITSNALEQLIPTFGPRHIFMKCLKEYRLQKQDSSAVAEPVAGTSQLVSILDLNI